MSAIWEERHYLCTADRCIEDDPLTCIAVRGVESPRPALDVERLAFLIYVRCGDRSVATAREDAAAIIRGLASAAPIPDWFASQYAALA